MQLTKPSSLTACEYNEEDEPSNQPHGAAQRSVFNRLTFADCMSTILQVMSSDVTVAVNVAGQIPVRLCICEGHTCQCISLMFGLSHHTCISTRRDGRDDDLLPIPLRVLVRRPDRPAQKAPRWSDRRRDRRRLQCGSESLADGDVRDWRETGRQVDVLSERSEPELAMSRELGEEGCDRTPEFAD